MLFSNAIEMYRRSSTAKMWKHVLGMAKCYINSLSPRPPAKGLTSLLFWLECCLLALAWMSAGYQASFLVKKKNPCFYFNTMEANGVLHMHELLEAADLDGIKAIYDDLLARIGAGKIFPLFRMPPKSWAKMSRTGL